jgi:hypothetical protein
MERGKMETIGIVETIEKIEMVEKHNIEYSCGCVHEIALPRGGGWWQPTGNNKKCSKHK